MESEITKGSRNAAELLMEELDQTMRSTWKILKQLGFDTDRFHKVAYELSNIKDIVATQQEIKQ